MLVGVISDTHGLSRPEALEALQGSEAILHAGDIGSPSVLEALERVAPVHAIRGNNDRESWARALPETRTIELAGHRFHLLHDVQDLDVDPVAAGLSAVVSGHSHKPGFLTRDGVLYFNPGSAGPRRFKLPIAVGLIEIEGASLRPRVVEL